MPLKIKVKPEDFMVEEIARLPLVKNGEYGAYLLTKKGWNTVELLLELSGRLNVPFRNFAYGGRKDRYGLTSQYVSIKGRRYPDINERAYSLKFAGFMRRPMGPDLIRENKFDVTVRRLSKDYAQESAARIKDISSFGYPNYFDDQRFGSFDIRQGFLAEKILKKEFNGALKIYMTYVYAKGKKEERDRRAFFFAHWKDWKACRTQAKTRFEEEAFDFLLEKPAGFLELLKSIPRHELSPFFSAYQSYLWNEILRRLITSEIPGPFSSYKGLAGDYIFYTGMNQKAYSYLRDLNIPVPGYGFIAGDEPVKRIYIQVMEDNNLKNSSFNRVKLRQVFFKSFSRQAIVKPRDLNFELPDDEIYTGNKKLRLKFFLPRGSYATMLIKSIFSQFAVEKSGIP
ncbi:MAG: tRNA pseudouridine(13) synthase TruD [Deltaproteobacteria bacterium]